MTYLARCVKDIIFFSSRKIVCPNDGEGEGYTVKDFNCTPSLGCWRFIINVIHGLSGEWRRSYVIICTYGTWHSSPARPVDREFATISTCHAPFLPVNYGVSSSPNVQTFPPKLPSADSTTTRSAALNFRFSDRFPETGCCSRLAI
jgi:hypothetical protein